MLSIAASCVIRKIVTYHYTVLVEQIKQKETKGDNGDGSVLNS
jgi:hypothetical protein